ncbi:uncharacterized protein ASPGLDRAFT_23832 [Aspergillus glaucus CBS 516.65]|uniref:Uncharacterized protein n=1 Tax=Aspergillus glaucus CBS 516.65 TaxID=1160497 RepID=A0A1L9VRW7_ASPGL|nr:hypothetical protein ASPGLDRAFT_23832 [Aspergillus glaucus CBS 516.65]OJJ86668.1 hypothetical protein ASPGLDRAFT_23832 [Aspergillus glaucus CBS 516.65]
MARTPHRWASLIELDVERIDWLSIAEHLPGRNNKECRKHWHQKFATNTNYGSWTDKEDERLHMAIGQHGTKWALVAQAVGTRSSEQCSKRWNDVLNPDLNRSPWTDEDDNLLESSVDTHGRNWKSIAQLHFQDRSALSLKNRHALLLRRQSRGNQNQRDILPSLESDGSGPQQGALTTPGDSPHSSQSAADEFESTPNNENDIQNSSPHGHDNGASMPVVTSSGGFGGDSFMPFGQNSNIALDMSTYDNNLLTGDMSRIIQDSSFSPGQIQQSHHQQHSYPDMSSFNPLPAGIDFSVPPTPPSIVPNSKGSSEETEWEEFLCLGISCPRKGLEAFKMAVLEAVTKGPSCQASDDDDKVQIMLKVRRKPQLVFEPRKT